MNAVDIYNLDSSKLLETDSNITAPKLQGYGETMRL